MSAGVAAQLYLFSRDPGLRVSSTECDELPVRAMEQGLDVETIATWTKVQFCHNHLHDLESLWCVAERQSMWRFTTTSR